MVSVSMARQAMATRFEFVLWGSNEIGLRAAGEAAFREIERLEEQLSLYKPSSQLSRINRCAGRDPVKVDPQLLRLLVKCRELSRITKGTFDTTIAPLVDAWGFMNGGGVRPEASTIDVARAKVGFSRVDLDEHHGTVRFQREGMMLDLGSIGKGYALDRAACLLRESAITSALLHGGTSTAYSIGRPPDQSAWKVAIERPDRYGCQPEFLGSPTEARARKKPLAIAEIMDQAVSVSSIWGKCFQADDQTFGHVIDPRTGEPVRNASVSCVVSKEATEADAFSTALLVMGEAGIDTLANYNSALGSLVANETGVPGDLRIASRNLPCDFKSLDHG